MQANNKQRIKQLIDSKRFRLPQPHLQSPHFTFPQLNHAISGSSVGIGNICGCIVVQKDEAKKELIMHIICVYEDGQSKNISHERMKGFIKSYDLKVDHSIFTYINSFQQINPGAFINAVIRRTEKRSQEIFYEMCLNKPQTKASTKVKMGVVKDDLEIPSSIMAVYQKEKTLPMNFQILYSKDFDNPGLTQILIKKMKIDEYGSLHTISNISDIDRLQLHPERIRYRQEKRWAKDHFERSIEAIKNGNNEIALEALSIAKDFDHQNPEIFIARSCAFVNMKNFGEGFKEIKEALRIEPNNIQAKKVYEQIRGQMTKRQKEMIVVKKTPSSGSNSVKHS